MFNMGSISNPRTDQNRTSELADLKLSVDELTSEKNHIKARLKASEEKISKLEIEIQLRPEMDDVIELKKGIDMAQEKMNELKKLALQKVADMDILQKQYNILQETCFKLKNEKEQLEKYIRTCPQKEQIESLENKISELSHSMSSLKEGLDVKERENQKLQAALENLEVVKKPIEIRSPGKHILSKTENGESVSTLRTYPKKQCWNTEHTIPSTSKSDNGVTYDDENFPPFNCDSSPVCSNVRVSPEPNGSKEVRPSYETTESYRRRSDEGSSSYKTSLKNRSEVSESHNNNDVNYDNENSSPVKSDSILLCSNLKTSSESNNSREVKTRYESNGSHKRRDNEGFFSRKTFSRYRCEVSESHDNNEVNYESNSSRELNMRYKSNGPHRKRNNEGSVYYDRFYRNRNEVSESQATWNTEQSGRNKTYFKSNNKNYSSNEIVANEPFRNKTTFKTGDKIVRSENNYCTDSRSSLKANRIDEKEKMWDNVLQFVDDDILNDAVINKSEEQATKPYDNRNRSILNNLNEDKKSEKIDIQNKNVYAYDSNCTGNIVASCTANEREDQNFLAKGIYTVHTNSSITNMQKNAPEVKNEPTSDLNRLTLNAETKEFVPYHGTSRAFPEISFETFNLENLMTYKSDLMSGEQLKSYTNALKTKVSMQILEFTLHDQEELKFLCELISDNQTLKYLNVISSRMCLIIRRALTHLTSPDCQKPHGGNPRMFNHGNQNHSLGRRHQNSRVGAFRH